MSQQGFRGCDVCGDVVAVAETNEVLVAPVYSGEAAVGYPHIPAFVCDTCDDEAYEEGELLRLRSFRGATS